MSKYSLLGCYGEGNLGDEAILAGMKHLIMEADHAAEFLIYIGDEAYRYKYTDNTVLDLHLVKLKHWYGLLIKGKILDILRSMLNSDVMVIGGGELIRDDFGLFPLLSIFESALLAKIFGNRLLLLGIGVGRLDTRLGQYLTKRILLWADKIVVRDIESQKILQDLDQTIDVKFACDVAFTLPTVSKVNSLSKASMVAVSLRDWPSAWSSKKLSKDTQLALHDKFMTELAFALKILEERYRCSFVFIPFRVENGDDDRKTITDVIARADLANFKILDFCIDPLEVKQVIAKCDMVIGMRLHACILALSEGVPALAINYDHKNTKLMSYFNLKECILDIYASDRFEYLSKMLMCLKISREQIESELNRNAEEFDRIYSDCLKNK